jgi:peptide/nickel transport system substrate-binding protein
MRDGVAARLRASRERGVTRHEPVRGPARRRVRRGLAAGCAAAALALAAAACGSGSTAPAGSGTPQSGGTVAWAEQPQNYPDFIFPFDPPQHFSITDIDTFQNLMYRPLLWFGNGAQPTLNSELSLASQPRYHGNQVTIQLKPNYRWSDGTPVTAQNVMFWMNMMKAEKLQWGGYVAGFFPDNISSYKAVSPTEVTFTIKGSFSQQWFTDNELSQITPMPKAWDVTAAGRSNCTAHVADCAGVWTYLTAQANNTKTYATSKIWSVVDGPWKLKSFALDGLVEFTYNSQYGGKVPAHHITTFIQRPFTTEQEEYNVLQAGGRNGLDVGYLPTVDAPVRPAGARVGANPLPGYRLEPLFSWGLSYIPYDYANPTAGPMFKQLYVRRALQYLVDQEGVVNGPLHGYGSVSLGPVGDVPVTRYLSAQTLSGDRFALNPAAATKLLTGHGWRVVPNGTTTCVSPGTGTANCGKGIARGTPLSFTMGYDGGISWVASAVRELASNASEVGIKITLKEGTFNSVVSQIAAPGTWQTLDWGGGWSYSPDYLPTGEELFGTTSADNFGGYSDTTNDHLIAATLHARSTADFYRAFYKWQNYLSGQLPNMLEPEGPYQLTEIADDLKSTGAMQTPTMMLTPEDWYLVK